MTSPALPGAAAVLGVVLRLGQLQLCAGSAVCG
jgi:hypothetical protein